MRHTNGGHDVKDDVIEFNFIEGIARMQKSLSLFDNLTFIDGTSNYGKIVAHHISKCNIHHVCDNPPIWFSKFFAKGFEELV